MTVLGYFNALRELGSARRILEEEVQNTLKGYGARKRIGESTGLFQDRKTFSEVVELTSRVPTNKVAEARRRLESPYHRIDQRVDCAIATNMISVGLDIPRLGLMVVLGQPKTHAEYIQATSRVGRDDTRPGLVVTVLNIHKPRDRSHYERFRHYHETFYRAVEVASVTPFSARALDRGFAGALVGLARHAQPALTPPQGAEQIGGARAALERRLLDSFLARVRQQPFADEGERDERLRSVHNRVVDLLDSWRAVVEDYRAAGVEAQYQRYELRQPRPLLRDVLETQFESEHHRKFRANRSLRDVEPEVNLFLKDLSGVQIEDRE
jgi:superfamily II DNA or RNA helicase